ncbi:isoprenoid synthase domain-containing protein [Scleroderma citrinum]
MSMVYRLPNFVARCPRKTTPISPYFSKLEKEFNKWVDTFPLFGNRERIAYKSGQIPLFASLCFPFADLKGLRAIVDLMAAIIFLDKANETASAEDAERNTSVYFAAFDHPQTGMASSNYFVQLISRFALGATAVISEEYKADFSLLNAAFARSTTQEAVERRAAKMNNLNFTLDTYLPTRRCTMGARPFLVYIRSLKGLKISRALLEHPTVKGMELEAVEMVIITNDVYSYKKELRDDGASHNILTVLMQDPTTGCSDLQHAIDYATNLFNEAMDRFNAYRAVLPKDDPQLIEYTDAMVDGLVGGIEWQVMSPRYKVFKTEEDRIKGLMRL